jgi:cysteine-rich repeat protein
MIIVMFFRQTIFCGGTQMKAFIALVLLLLSVSSSFAAGNVKLYTDLEFSDNSVQKKALTLPSCNSGDFLVNNSGAWYCGKFRQMNHGLVMNVHGEETVFSCDAGYGDCDGISSNGCEASLYTPMQCSNCGGISCAALNECSFDSFVGGAFVSTGANLSPGSQCTGGTCDGSGHCIPFPVCGNGKVEAGEQCDDGNTTNSDGCSNTCMTEHGFQCNGSPSVCNIVCGDGVVAGQEQCDDGNTTNGDGCSSTCQIESIYMCTSEPSVCAVDGCKANPCTPAPGPTCLNGTLTMTSLVCTPIGSGQRTCNYPSFEAACISGTCSGNVCKP